MFEIEPINVIGGKAYGTTSRIMEDGHGGKVICRMVDLNNEIGSRDLDTGVFRLDPIKSGGFRFGRPNTFGDSMKVW